MVDKTNEILNYYGLAANIEETKKWVKKYVNDAMSGFTTDLMQNVTYNELVSLRDNGKLIPGMLYRMTDYETIIPDDLSNDYDVAGHKFDIIIKADSHNSLNENVRFIEHQGESYFNDSKLNAWEGKYCIDNDATRFKFAGQEGNPGLGFAAIQVTDGGTPYFLYKRYPEADSEGWYAWAYNQSGDGFDIDSTEISWTSIDTNDTIFTSSESPAIGSYNDDEEYEIIDYSSNVGYVPYISTGKGVIYYLKDEFGNEAPYDFKNILQRDEEYTFGNDGTDYSIGGNIHGVYDNKIKPFVDEDGLLSINQVRFTEENTHSNLVKASCQNSYIESGLTETDISMNDDGELVLFKTQEFISGIENKEIPVSPLAQYLTFEAIDDNCTILFHCNDYEGTHVRTIEVSTDMQEWNSFTSSKNSTVLATLNSGEKLYVRGNNGGYCDTEEYYDEDTGQWETVYYFSRFVPTENCYVYGNIMSLISPNNFKDLKEFSTDCTFYSLFYGGIYYDGRTINNTLFMAEDKKVLLPATTLSERCYSYMFYGCYSLTEAPELPATTLANYCYQGMFRNCTSLVKVPELPATTLSTTCYNGMFGGCTSLTSVPQNLLPATTLANNCYSSMFSGCENLTTLPELPATTLANYCYQNMFYGCTSLTTAPTLPATVLYNNCYRQMFGRCTNLTTIPENMLPATDLTNAIYCYASMFDGCPSLTSVPQNLLPATTLVNGCYSWMFRGCTNLTTAPTLPAETLVQSCYNQMFSSCTNLNYIKCLAIVIPENSCTSNWVNGVQTNSGTFVKGTDVEVWGRGNSGIPYNWTIQDA